MNFQEATDVALRAGITLGELAAELGHKDPATVRRARMEPGEHSRNPPEGWEAALARIARQRAAVLAELAEGLEAGE